MAALRVAAQDVVHRGQMKITVLSDYDIIYAWKDLPSGEGHAGMLETSRILVQRPDLVKGVSPPGKNAIPPHAVLADARPYWPGVTGDPSKATKELGARLDAMVVEELVTLVDELKRRR
jgi:creatinine amidohydrolase